MKSPARGTVYGGKEGLPEGAEGGGGGGGRRGRGQPTSAACCQQVRYASSLQCLETSEH